MPIQSIRRTRVPGVRRELELDHRTYREVWPELRLREGSVEQQIGPSVGKVERPAAGKIARPDAGKPAPLRVVLLPHSAAGKVNIAIVDSGIPAGESGRPFDEPYRTPIRSVADNSLDRDDDGHATDLAAAIRGLKKHSAPNINLRFIKPFSAQGWPTPGRGAEAIKRAVELGARVIVLAWDAGHTTDELRKAILDARGTAVVVIAAGNWSLDNDKYPNWPANYGGKKEMDHVITVMATDEHDEPASFSSYGRRSVYIAAPGFARLDAAPSSSPLRTAGSLRNSDREFRGTSAATAHVARLAALVLAKYPKLSPQQVKQHIGKTARKVDALKELCVKGAIVDFAKALK